MFVLSIKQSKNAAGGPSTVGSRGWPANACIEVVLHPVMIAWGMNCGMAQQLKAVIGSFLLQSSVDDAGFLVAEIAVVSKVTQKQVKMRFPSSFIFDWVIDTD